MRLQLLQEAGQLDGGVEYDPYIGARLRSDVIDLIRDGEIVQTIGPGH